MPLRAGHERPKSRDKFWELNARRIPDDIEVTFYGVLVQLAGGELSPGYGGNECKCLAGGDQHVQ